MVTVVFKKMKKIIRFYTTRNFRKSYIEIVRRSQTLQTYQHIMKCGIQTVNYGLP